MRKCKGTIHCEDDEEPACYGNMLRLSQADLAAKLSVSRQQVAAIETFKRKMSWSIFLSLVLIFSLDESTLLMMKTFEIYTPELISLIEGTEAPIRENERIINEASYDA